MIGEGFWMINPILRSFYNKLEKHKDQKLRHQPTVYLPGLSSADSLAL